MSEPKKKVIFARYCKEFYGVAAFTEHLIAQLVPEDLMAPETEPRDWKFKVLEVTRRELENAVDGEITDAEWDRTEGYYQGN